MKESTYVKLSVSRTSVKSCHSKSDHQDPAMHDSLMAEHVHGATVDLDDELMLPETRKAMLDKLFLEPTMAQDARNIMYNDTFRQVTQERASYVDPLKDQMEQTAHLSDLLKSSQKENQELRRQLEEISIVVDSAKSEMNRQAHLGRSLHAEKIKLEEVLAATKMYSGARDS